MANAIIEFAKNTLRMCGRDERIRTSDPHTPSVVRYQTALHPEIRHQKLFMRAVSFLAF